MRLKPTLIDKKVKKLQVGKCHFCEIDDYALLECHRIVPGEEGGKYYDHNVVVCCCNCHTRIHDGQMTLDRWYQSTSGRKELRYYENNEEKWK